MGSITRTRFPRPTVEDLMLKLQGTKVFSKLSLTSAFYQLEFTPESRGITAFQTENTVKRFKRLIFGENSAGGNSAPIKTKYSGYRRSYQHC